MYIATSIYSKVLILKCSMGVVGGASTVLPFLTNPYLFQVGGLCMHGHI